METLLPNVITQSQPALRIDVRPMLDRGFDLLFLGFVFVTIFLPGGSIYGFSYKYPIYFCLLPLAGYSMFRRGLATRSSLIALCAVPVVLAFWIAIGLAHGFGLPGSLRQYGDILLTFLLCWWFVVFCQREPARRLRFLKLVLNASIATAALKIALLLYAAASGTPVLSIVFWMDRVFGVDLMSMDLGALLGRIQFLSDELIPICIFTLLRYRSLLRIGSVRAALTILLLLVSVLFSFSRYFWSSSAFAFVLGLLLAERDRFRAVLSGILGLAMLLSLPALITLYEIRFSADVAGDSDSVRTGQIPVLMTFFSEAPLLGHGLGSYSTTLMRDTTETGHYGYEVQLLALPGQIGLVGMAFILLLGAWFYTDLWWPGGLTLRDRLAISSLLAFWVAGGLTNPLLFHPIAGMNYAALAALAGLSEDRLRPAAKLPGTIKLA